MMYPFMTLNDDTEITPGYDWEEIFQYSDEEIDRFDEIIHSMAHLIMEFSQEGGFDNASNF